MKIAGPNTHKPKKIQMVRVQVEVRLMDLEFVSATLELLGAMQEDHGALEEEESQLQASPTIGCGKRLDILTRSMERIQLEMARLHEALELPQSNFVDAVLMAWKDSNVRPSSC